MIRRLRERHRIWTAVTTLTALGGLTLAIAAREPPARMAVVPPLPGEETPTPTDAPRRAGVDLWEGASIDTAIYDDQVRLVLLDPLRRPDPLLYWAERATAPGEGLPADAVLLGAIGGHGGAGEARFRLPRSGGALMIFSLAHGEVIARLTLEGAP